MPTYEFYNTETKEIEEHLMSYKDLDKFAEDNPHLEKRISATATISQAGSTLNKTSGDWKNLLTKIKKEAGGNNESGIVLNDKDAASGFTHMGFRRSGTEIGSISRNGSNDSILFTTSSDYRLKDGIVDKTDGIEKIKLLKPRKFYWKSNADKTLVDGFLAHEVSDVVPEAISGTKDAVDENGDIIPQGIDQSNLVPLLTAALKEAITEIESLKARVTTLEG